MGNEQIIYLSLADQIVIARRLQVNSLEIGKEMGIFFSKDKIVFLEEKSGEVIK